MGSRHHRRRGTSSGNNWVLGAVALLTLYAAPVRGTDASGTVQFQGNVVFAAPIAGIAANDLEVSVRASTEATEAILALAHGVDDQQVDPPNAEGVDATVLKEQIKCQKRFGKAAANFSAKRLKLIQKNCVDAGQDTDPCRDAQSRTAKKKLDQIDKCVVDQQVDGGTGLPVPALGAPCDVCIDGGGAIDRKCLKSCFEIAIDELSDCIMGDLPVCGDGILQPGEFCDDGNTIDGDGCSSTCTVEMGP
jgi:cysteine-rich repeat protein